MEMNPEQLERVDPLALSNTITISALVGLLIRKGLFSADELTEEIRVMRARLSADKSAADDA